MSVKTDEGPVLQVMDRNGAPGSGGSAAGDETPRKIAVLGATGRTGVSFIKQLLVARGMHAGLTVRAVCRDPEKLKRQFDDGGTSFPAQFVEAVKGDVWSRESLRRCLDGCDAVFSFLEFSHQFGGCCSMGLDSRKSCCVPFTRGRYNPQYREWMQQVLVSVCLEAGIQRVVLQSTWFSQSHPCANPCNLCATGNCGAICLIRGTCGAGMWNGFQMMEDVLKKSSLDYTIVHCPVLQGDMESPARSFQAVVGKDQLGMRNGFCVPCGCLYMCCSARTYPDVARFFVDNMDNYFRESVVFQ